MKLQKYTLNVVSKFSHMSMATAKAIAPSEEEAIEEVAKYYLERYSFNKDDLLWYVTDIEEVIPEVIEFRT